MKNIFKFKTIPFIFVLIFSFTSCLDFTVIYRINEKGKVTSTVILESADEYGAYLLSGFKSSLEEDGYLITNETSSKIEGVYYSDINKLFNIDRKNLEGMSENSAGGMNTSVMDFIENNSVSDIGNFREFVIDYKAKDIEEGMDTSGIDYQFYESIYGSMNFKMTIYFPGKIIETTGVLVENNRVDWEYSFLELFRDKKRFYLKSKVPLKNDVYAGGRLITDVYDISEEIDRLIFKKFYYIDLKKRQDIINENIADEVKKSDDYLVQAYNILAKEYFKENNRYPTNFDAVKEYAKKFGFDTFPEAKDGTIIYNFENNIFTIEY